RSCSAASRSWSELDFTIPSERQPIVSTSGERWLCLVNRSKCSVKSHLAFVGCVGTLFPGRSLGLDGDTPHGIFIGVRSKTGIDRLSVANVPRTEVLWFTSQRFPRLGDSGWIRSERSTKMSMTLCSWETGDASVTRKGLWLKKRWLSKNTA